MITERRVYIKGRTINHEGDMNLLIGRIAGIGAVLMLASCSKTADGPTEGEGSAKSQITFNSSSQALVSFKLTDAPNKDLKSVVVDIDHMEVLLSGNGKAGRLKLAQGLGPVDLLTLQNGITLPLQDIVAPAGLQVQQIRLILKPSGHYAIKSDDSICELKTPSAQKTGVKIILTNKVQFEAGHQYSIVVDFDALKSVVVQGNGRCLLKPVLKLKSALKQPIVEQPEPGSGDSGGSDGGATDEGSTGGGAADGGSSDGGEVVDGGSSGEELVTQPDQNDGSSDGWDYTPIVDGEDYPVISEDQLDQLL